MAYLLDVKWSYKTRVIPSLLRNGEKLLNPDLLRSKHQQRQLGKSLECTVVLVYSDALAHFSGTAIKMFQSQIVLGKEYMSSFLREPNPDDKVFIAKRRKPK